MPAGVEADWTGFFPRCCFRALVTVRLPEISTGHLRHLDVVGTESLIDGALPKKQISPSMERDDTRLQIQNRSPLSSFDPCKSVLSVSSVVRFGFLCKAHRRNRCAASLPDPGRALEPGPTLRQGQAPTRLCRIGAVRQCSPFDTSSDFSEAGNCQTQSSIRIDAPASSEMYNSGSSSGLNARLSRHAGLPRTGTSYVARFRRSSFQ